MIKIEKMKETLVVPASKINAKKINFMAKHGRGFDMFSSYTSKS